MAYARPKDLDGFLAVLNKPDTKFRQQLGADLLTYLADPENSVECEDIGLCIDGLGSWMQSSNYKVSSNGIEILTYLIDRLGHDFRPYLQTVLPNVLDRLGDAKDTVREKSQLLILKLLEKGVLSPQTLLEKLQSGFSHKNAKIREEILRCLVNTLNEHGAQSLHLTKFIPDIVNLLSDPSASVRDAAHTTLVDLYKHVGDKLRIDLQRRNIVPQSKWPALSARFDEVRNRGELLPTAVLTSTKSVELNNFDEIDRAPTAMSKPIVPVKKPNLGSAVKQRTISAGSANSVFSRVGSLRAPTNPSGAVDEDFFLKSFHECPTVQIFSAREVTEHMKTIQEIIGDTNKEWNKRVDALKKIRSLVIADATSYDEFYVCLKNLQIPLQASVTDLRSQVVREASITISFLAQRIGIKFDKIAESVLQPLINLIQNSVKVMATSGLITVKYIIQNIESPRLLPIITNNAIKSKSRDIRKACCEFVETVLANWPRQPLEKHLNALQEAVKSGITDADPEARLSSRRAFKHFKDYFPDQAEILLQSLELGYRRALQGGEGMSASSSHNNIAASTFKTPRQYGKTSSTTSPGSATDSGRKGFRSNSAIDLQAAQRAKARAQYSAMARSKIQSGTASLQGEVAQQARPRKSPETLATASPERISRTRNRSSQSQPTSRSGSPSSRLAYLYHRPGPGGDPASSNHHHPPHQQQHHIMDSSPRPRRLSSGIPRSTQGSRDASRETSPTRSTSNLFGASGSGGRFRRSGGGDRPPLSPASRPVLAQKILQQSREAENALADVLNSSDHFRSSPRRNMRSLDNQSDESETSSVCSERSERSFDSFKRPSDDINQIIAMCASTNWQERKDGLLSLQYYIANEIPLTAGELKHLTEIFTRMFMDSHTKGLGVFLDTLHEVIKTYKHDLHSWMYVLLQRVFLKIGTETLNSIHNKLMTTLDIIRNSFPADLLVANVYRFLIDATQTPTARVKTVVMNFLASLCNSQETAHYLSQPPAGQALQKIILYALDNKSVETRNAARTCLVAMWNCNTAEVTMMLTELPKEQEDVAKNICQNHMRKSTNGSEPGSPVLPISSSPRVISPLRDTSGGDQEEFYRSLRRTTAEIQNYSFEIGAKLERDTASQDSGISQMSIGNDIHNMAREITSLEDGMEDLSIRPNFKLLMKSSGSAGGGGPRSLPPYANVNGVTETDSNGFRSLGEIKDSEQIVLNIIENCLAESPDDVKRKLLVQLLEIITLGHIEHVKKHFKKILRLLIDNLHEEQTIQVTVLQILRAIFQNLAFKECWMEFVELLTLRVLNAHTVEKREVVKEAELTAAAMSVCPFNTIVSTLAPFISTSPYPGILGAIKMLTKMIESNRNEVTDEHLKQIMPGLIKGTDHCESSVRKSSIFCMVAIHNAVGAERLEPHIATLTGSKLKLLRLYIGRSEQTVPTTTASSTTSTSSSSMPTARNNGTTTATATS